MELSRQEYWSRLPFLSLEDLPDPGIKPTSPALQADSLPLSHLGSPSCRLSSLNLSGLGKMHVSGLVPFLCFSRLSRRSLGAGLFQSCLSAQPPFFHQALTRSRHFSPLGLALFQAGGTSVEHWPHHAWLRSFKPELQKPCPGCSGSFAPRDCRGPGLHPLLQRHQAALVVTDRCPSSDQSALVLGGRKGERRWHHDPLPPAGSQAPAEMHGKLGSVVSFQAATGVAKKYFISRK